MGIPLVYVHWNGFEGGACFYVSDTSVGFWQFSFSLFNGLAPAWSKATLSIYSGLM